MIYKISSIKINNNYFIFLKEKYDILNSILFIII